MVIRCREDRKSIFPVFHLSGVALCVSRELKYLGHIISEDLTDDSDIQRQCRKIYAQANMLLRKFSLCSVNVKCALFRSYVTPLYTAHLWSNYKVKSMRKLRVAYNDAMRLLLRVPRWHSASQLFTSVGVPTCEALLRQLMYNFMKRLETSDNSIIVGLTNPTKSCYRVTSKLRKHWFSSLLLGR